MGLTENYSVLTLVLVSSLAVLAAVWISFYSLRRYEIAIALMLLSPWAGWVFLPNVEQSAEEMTAVGPGTYLRIGTVALVGIMGILQFIRLRSISRRKIPFHLVLLGILMFYALLSTIYSIDVRYTLVRASESLLFFGFLLGFHYWLKDEARLDRALNIHCAIVICGVFVNIMAIVLFREKVWCWNMPDRFQGLLGHPNIMGAFCMMSYPVLMWKYSGLNSAGKVAVGLLFCIVVGVHLMSGSRSSLAGAVFGCLIWRFIVNRGADLCGWVRICTVVLVVLLCGALLVRTKPAAFQRDDAAPITDLTDRPEFWRGCLVLAKERPILGYGFGVAGKVWSDPRFRRPGYFLWSGTAKSSLHNGYLTLLIGLGGVGVLLWLSSVVVPIRRVLWLRPSRYKALVLVICSQALLLSFFESALASYSQNYVAMLFWMCLIIAGRLPFLVSYGQDNGVAPKTAMVGGREEEDHAR